MMEYSISKEFTISFGRRHKRKLCGENSASSAQNIGEISNGSAKSELQARLNEIHDQGIIGVEYIIEVYVGESFEPNFHCVLCEGRFDLHVVLNHLTAYAHRLKYLEKHFPTAFKSISSLEKREQKYSFLEKICQNIEDYYGRLAATFVRNKEFSANQMNVYEAVKNARHFDEQMGRTFAELFDENDGHRLSPISDICEMSSNSTWSDFDVKVERSHQLNEEPFDIFSTARNPFKVSDVVMLSSSRSSSPNDLSSIPPDQSSPESLQSRSECRVADNRLQNRERRVRKVGKCHPNVKQSECMQVKISKESPTRQLSRENQRKRHTYGTQLSTRQDTSLPSQSLYQPYSRIGRRFQTCHHHVQPTPHRNADRSFHYNNMAEKTPSGMELCIAYRPIQTSIDSDSDDEPTTIVSVLSLLSGFVDLLGSLGPKTIDMMTEAITMEQNSVNSSNGLLDDDSHCIVFDTIKEKLKGFLRADMVEPDKRISLKKTVDSMDALIREADARKSVNTSSQTANHRTEGHDRSAIAAKMLIALREQGRVDISELELADYVEQYIKMATVKQYGTDAPKNSTAEVVEKPHQDGVTSVSAQGSINTDNNYKSKAIQMLKTDNRTTLNQFPSETTSLSDSNLRTLIKKFSVLSDMEKHDLIARIRELEDNDPERLKRLSNEVDTILNSEFGSSKMHEDDKKMFIKLQSEV